ncbi:MAG: hypothetical protein ABI599_11510 [Flavobacteriales bacterium]
MSFLKDTGIVALTGPVRDGAGFVAMGINKLTMKPARKDGENRPLNPNTVPPSTPQGPESNDMLVSPEYKDGPYPAEIPGAERGEGSPVATHSTGIDPKGSKAGKEVTGKGEARPNLDRAGRDPKKTEGRDVHEP